MYNDVQNSCIEKATSGLDYYVQGSFDFDHVHDLPNQKNEEHSLK